MTIFFARCFLLSLAAPSSCRRHSTLDKRTPLHKRIVFIVFLIFCPFVFYSPQFSLHCRYLSKESFLPHFQPPRSSLKILNTLPGVCKCDKRQSPIFKISLIHAFARFHIQESQQKVTSHPSQDM